MIICIVDDDSSSSLISMRGLLELREAAEKRNLKLVLRHMATPVYKALKLSGHAWQFVVDHGD